MRPPPPPLVSPVAAELEAVGARPRGIAPRQVLWPMLLSLAVLAAVLWWTWEPETLALMARMNLGLMALAVAMVGLRILLSGLRLAYISRGTVSVAGGVRGGLAWDFLSAVTPSAMGGAPLAAYYLARDNRLPVGETTAIMLFSMLTDQVWFALSIPIVLLAAPFLDVIPNTLGTVGAGTIVLFLLGMLVWAVFFAYATLIRPELLEALATWIVRFRWLRRFEGRVKRELVAMRQRAHVLRGQPPRFYVKSFLLAVGVWLSRYAVLLFVVLSVYPALDVFTFYVRIATMTLTSLVVPTPGGSGGIEALYVIFLAPLMPQALVGPTLLTWRLLSYYLFIAFGVAAMFYLVQRLRTTPAALPMPSAGDGAPATGQPGAGQPAADAPRAG